MEYENIWFNEIKQRLKEYTSSPYWNSIQLSKLYNAIVGIVLDTDTFDELPQIISFSTVDRVVELIDNRIAIAKREQVGESCSLQ